MTVFVCRKIEQYVKLSGQDKAALDLCLNERKSMVPTRHDIIAEGDPPADVHFILSGWACRYKHLADGRRQILALLLPGDVCTSQYVALREMDHSIGTLSAVTLAKVSRAAVTALSRSSRLDSALRWQVEVNVSAQREWTVNLGQRNAFERIAHLFCEIFHRLRGVGLVDGTLCEVPLTQGDIGDATGMTSVHVNRIVQDIRGRRLITLNGRHLSIDNLPALEDAALFDPSYLHMRREGRQLDAGKERDEP